MGSSHRTLLPLQAQAIQPASARIPLVQCQSTWTFVQKSTFLTQLCYAVLLLLRLLFLRTKRRLPTRFSMRRLFSPNGADHISLTFVQVTPNSSVYFTAAMQAKVSPI